MDNLDIVPSVELPTGEQFPNDTIGSVEDQIQP